MLNNNLKQFREKKKYSKMKLAKESGVSRRTIQLIEDKIITNSKMETLEKLAKALNVSVEDLIK